MCGTTEIQEINERDNRIPSRQKNHRMVPAGKTPKTNPPPPDPGRPPAGKTPKTKPPTPDPGPPPAGKTPNPNPLVSVVCCCRRHTGKPTLPATNKELILK